MNAKKIPGPRELPLVGSLPAMSRDPLGFLTNLARDHGDVARFSAVTLPFVQLNDPELIHQLLTTHNHAMRKSFDVRQLELMLGKGLLTSEGDLWKRQRKLLQPAFHNDRIRAYGDIMVRRARAAVERWSDGGVLDVHAEMSRVTLEIVCEALFGSEPGDDTDVIADALDTFMERFEQFVTSTVPVPLTWTALPRNRKAARAAEDMSGVVHRLIQRRLASKERGDDLLSWLLEAGEHARNPEQLRDELVTLLLAGHETTALALAYAFMLVAEHPEVERRLLEESAALGRAPNGGDERALPYHRQVVEEAMRLYPPAWGIAREAIEPVELGGYRLRKRTTIIVTQWVTHRDPRFWPDPERFDPDRFTAEAKRSRRRYAYLPFGGGQRVCIGLHFAMLEAVLVLATVLRSKHLTLAPDHRLELQPAVTLRPRHGIRMRVEPRERDAKPLAAEAAPATPD